MRRVCGKFDVPVLAFVTILLLLVLLSKLLPLSLQTSPSPLPESAPANCVSTDKLSPFFVHSGFQEHWEGRDGEGRKGKGLRQWQQYSIHSHIQSSKASRS